MGKAEHEGLEFRPSGADLEECVAYGLMASHFLRESSLSRNSATGEVRAGKLSASHLTVSGLWTPATLAPSESRQGTKQPRSVPRQKETAVRLLPREERSSCDQRRQRTALGRFAQHKPYAFGRQPIPILHAAILGLRIRQAESGLVKQQVRWLHRLETTGFSGLAAVIRALAVCARVSWENARLMGTSG